MALDSDVDELAGALYTAVSVLSRRARLLAAADEGLSLPERSVLRRIAQGRPSTAAELARAEQIRPQGMGLILGKLQDQGLINRHADPNDGRRLLVSITGGWTQDAGRETEQANPAARRAAHLRFRPHRTRTA